MRHPRHNWFWPSYPFDGRYLAKLLGVAGRNTYTNARTPQGHTRTLLDKTSIIFFVSVSAHTRGPKKALSLLFFLTHVLERRHMFCRPCRKKGQRKKPRAPPPKSRGAHHTSPTKGLLP